MKAKDGVTNNSGIVYALRRHSLIKKLHKVIELERKRLKTQELSDN